MTDYIICADGACSGNPGPGGFAWEIWEGAAAPGNEVTAGAGSSSDTTNNIMELRAAIDAFEALRDLIVSGDVPAGVRVKLRFDSEYVLKGIFEWMAGWKSRSWRTGGGKAVKNRELWEQVDALIEDLTFRQVELKADWVKGHAGDFGNERVDAKAVEMRDLAKLDVAGGAPAPAAAPGPSVPSAGLSLTALAEANGADTFDEMSPAPGAAPAPASAEVNPEQVRLMRTILDLYESGDYSVKKVIEQVRANAIALGCK